MNWKISGRMFIIMVMLFVANNLFAKSKIYVFVNDAPSLDIQLLCNGKKVCDLNGPVKKTYPATDPFIIPMVIRDKCYRLITTDDEGKLILSVETVHTNACNGQKTLHKGEIHLDIEDDETYYVELVRAGKFKEVNAKKGEKIHKANSKWVELPAIDLSK